MTTVVDHLKKVTLHIQSDERPLPFEFIVGAASEGLCPFEFELLHKSPGERCRLSIPREKTSRMLAHLQKPLCGALHLNEAREDLDLHITIVAVEDPEPREVVRAMAQAAEQNGCGGGCGCGCGGQ